MELRNQVFLTCKHVKKPSNRQTSLANILPCKELPTLSRKTPTDDSKKSLATRFNTMKLYRLLICKRINDLV